MYEDECVLGYLIRLSEANGFRHIGYLLHYAGLEWKNRRVPTHRILTGEFDLSSYLSGMGVDIRPNRSAYLHQKFRRSVDTNHIFGSSPKVCAECIAEMGYSKYLWSLLPVLSCAKHGRMLIDLHPKTGEKLSWYRERLCCFNDETKLAIKLSSPVPSVVEQISHHFERLASCEGGLQSAYPLISGLGLREALTVLNFLAHYNTRLMGGAFMFKTIANLSLAKIYVDAWKLIKDWPESFYLMLGQYIESPMSSRGKYGVNKHYRDLRDGFHRHGENAGIARMKAEFDRYIESYWPGLVDVKSLTRMSINPDHRSVLSKQGAAKILGCRPERIDKLVRCGRIERSVFKGRASYSRAEVEKLAQDYSSCWSMEQACMELGISRYQMKLLLDAGLLPVIQVPDTYSRDWKIDKIGCKKILDGFISRAKSTVDGERCGRQKRCSIVERFRRIQSGEHRYLLVPVVGAEYSLNQFVLIG